MVDTIAYKPGREEVESGFSSNRALQITIIGGKMKRKKILSLVFVFLFLLVSIWLRAEEPKSNPVAVSPGSDTEAVDALNKLNPVKYNYKIDETDIHVGFIAEDVPELVATAVRKGLSPMDITAVLTRVVQEQQKMIQEQQQVNQEYEKIISDLLERIARI